MSHIYTYPHIELSLRGSEKESPTLLDLTNFMYDFNLAYEISRLAVDPMHDEFKFSYYMFRRNGRPLKRHERLIVKRLRHESPIVIVTALTVTGITIGAIWGVIQIVDKIANWDLDQKIKRAQLRNLELDNLEKEKRLQGAVHSVESFNARLQKREAFMQYDQVTRRLDKSVITITDFEIRIVRQQGQDETPH